MSFSSSPGRLISQGEGGPMLQNDVQNREMLRLVQSMAVVAETAGTAGQVEPLGTTSRYAAWVATSYSNVVTLSPDVGLVDEVGHAQVVARNLLVQRRHWWREPTTVINKLLAVDVRVGNLARGYTNTLESPGTVVMRVAEHPLSVSLAMSEQEEMASIGPGDPEVWARATRLHEFLCSVRDDLRTDG